MAVGLKQSNGSYIRDSQNLPKSRSLWPANQIGMVPAVLKSNIYEERGLFYRYTLSTVSQM